MRKTTLEMLRMEFDTSSKTNQSGIDEQYVVSGSIPKALGSSLADQIRNSNNELRKKITY